MFSLPKFLTLKSQETKAGAQTTSRKFAALNSASDAQPNLTIVTRGIRYGGPLTTKGIHMRDHEAGGPPDPARREFLLTMGSTAAAAVIAGCAPVHHSVTTPTDRSDAPNIQGSVPITLRI